MSLSVSAPRPGGGRASVSPRRLLTDAVLHAGTVFAALMVVVPLIWLVLSSIKTDSENVVYPPTLIPHQLTASGYTRLVMETPYLVYLRNSLVVSVLATCAVIVLSVLASYALVRFRIPGAEWLVRLTLFSYTMPPILLVVPIVQIFVTLHLVNSLASLVVAYTALYLPLGIWILRGYFVGLDVDPEEAAMVDGATRFQAFYRIALPQAVPGLVSVAVFTFNACWNEYLYASVLVQAPGLLTLSAGLATFIGEVTMYSWTMLMAAGAVTIAPILVLFLYLQRFMVRGLSSGAVKG